MRRTLIFALGALCACTTSADDADQQDDDLAEASPELDGKADAITLSGAYRWTSDNAMWNNDIASLEITGGKYVRSRCYGFDCAHLVPQFGDVATVKSAGKTYLRFKSFVKKQSGEEWLEKPVTADTYEVKVQGDSIRLRKTYSHRWFTLASLAAQPLCQVSGGQWANNACTCAAPPGDWSHYTAFFPGLGGCFEIHATSEDGCDTTHGSYTDDDGNAIGTYCNCPLGTYETNDGCIAL